jgi:hypothetical protein
MFARGAVMLLAIGGSGIAVVLPTAVLGERVERPRHLALAAEPEPTLILLAPPAQPRPRRIAATAARPAASVRPVGAPPARVALPAAPPRAGGQVPRPGPSAAPPPVAVERPESQVPVLVAAASAPGPDDEDAVRAAAVAQVRPDPASQPGPTSAATSKPQNGPKAKGGAKPKDEPRPEGGPKPKGRPKPKGGPTPDSPPVATPEPELAAVTLEVAAAQHEGAPGQKTHGNGKPDKARPDKE